MVGEPAMRPTGGRRTFRHPRRNSLTRHRIKQTARLGSGNESRPLLKKVFRMSAILVVLIGVAIVVGGVLLLRMHAFLALTLGAITVGLLSGPAGEQTVGERVGEAFGTTCGKIGILIAMAAIIGKCLLDSGAADRIVRSALKWTGQRGAPLAFVGSGFLLAIPVFFDTVFYLMIPLGKAMRMRTGQNYLLYVLTIVAGGTMAHSLVPPTPGPLFVAEELGVDLGTMILAGCALGLVTSSTGYLFAVWMNARHELPLRASAELSLDQLRALAERDIASLPPLWLSLQPILLPVVLIADRDLDQGHATELAGARLGRHRYPGKQEHRAHHRCRGRAGDAGLAQTIGHPRTGRVRSSRVGQRRSDHPDHRSGRGFRQNAPGHRYRGSDRRPARRLAAAG